MKRSIFIGVVFLSTVYLAASGCSSNILDGTNNTDSSSDSSSNSSSDSSQTHESTVLYVTLGVHIEPHQNYNDPSFMELSVGWLDQVAIMVEKYEGHMTIQAQSPFSTKAIDQGFTILKDLAARGHEIALHFHEEAHLGFNANELPMETWCAVLGEEIASIQQASGVNQIRYWSGGNLYSSLLEASSCAGLDVKSDWKDPSTQLVYAPVIGLNPWRPAGNPQGSDLTEFAQHDPAGSLIFLPEGQYVLSGDFEDGRGNYSQTNEGYHAYYNAVVIPGLDQSLAAMSSDRINVFHHTIHVGEFLGEEGDFQVIEEFIGQHLKPLIDSGQAQWATFSEMADLFKDWEAAHPNVSPR